MLDEWVGGESWCHPERSRGTNHNAHVLEVREKATNTSPFGGGNDDRAIQTLLALILLHQKVITTVALKSEFTASSTPDALLAAAVGTDFWHGYRGILMKNGGFAKKKQEKTYIAAVLFLRPQHHHKARSLHPHIRLHLRIILESGNNAPELIPRKRLVAQLTSAQAHDEFNKMPLAEELLGSFNKTIEIVLLGTKTETEHLHFRLLGTTLLFPLLFLLLVEVLTDVTNFDDRRIRLGRNLNKIELRFFGLLECFTDWHTLGFTIDHKQYFRIGYLLIGTGSAG